MAEIVYCAVHDRPLSLCPEPGRCRTIMSSWGLYEDPGEELEK